MKIDILTLFPEMISQVLSSGVIGRAVRNLSCEINYLNIRDFSNTRYGSVDDYPYGGGVGMLMKAQPILDAYASLSKPHGKPYVVMTSPSGIVLSQEVCFFLKNKKHLVIISGRYEGIDERVKESVVDLEVSMGDFILTNGDIPTMAIVDSVVRLLPGTLKNEESISRESYQSGTLEHPQYTRPACVNKMNVPEVLISGNHSEICKWKLEKSIIETFLKRPTMFRKIVLNIEQRDMIYAYLTNKKYIKLGQKINSRSDYEDSNILN